MQISSYSQYYHNIPVSHHIEYSNPPVGIKVPQVTGKLGMKLSA